MPLVYNKPPYNFRVDPNKNRLSLLSFTKQNPQFLRRYYTVQFSCLDTCLQKITCYLCNLSRNIFAARNVARRSITQYYLFATMASTFNRRCAVQQQVVNSRNPWSLILKLEVIIDYESAFEIVHNVG